MLEDLGIMATFRFDALVLVTAYCDELAFWDHAWSLVPPPPVAHQLGMALRK